MEFSLEKQEAICVPNLFSIGVGWKCIDHPLFVPYNSSEPALEGMFIDSKSTTSTWNSASLGKAFSCNAWAKCDNVANTVLSSKHHADLRCFPSECQEFQMGLSLNQLENPTQLPQPYNLMQNCWTIMNSLFHFAKIKGQSFTPHFVVACIAVDFWGYDTAK